MALINVLSGLVSTLGNSIFANDLAPREYASNTENEIPFEPVANDPIVSSMGTAMRVKPKRTSERFANVKVALRKTIKVNETDPERLQLEKQKIKDAVLSLSRVRHHHMLRILTTYFCNGPNGLQFSIVMDFADENLRAYLQSTDPKFVPRAKWFGCLINVVAYIHERGIQHRDIKPESILVRDGSVLLTSFKIHEMDTWNRPALGRTVSTTVISKWARWNTAAGSYRAPETESHWAWCGRAADIFSLGAVFLELLLACVEHRDSSQEMPSNEKSSREKDAKESLFAQLESKLEFYKGNASGRSYALNVDAIAHWLAGVTLPDRQQGWESDMLSICRAMLDPEPDARPRADELSLQWKPLVDSHSSLACDQCHDMALLNDEDSYYSFKMAMRSGRGDASSTGVEAFHHASAAGDVDMVRDLLRSAAVTIDATCGAEETALFHAAGNGREDVVMALLDAQTTAGSDVRAMVNKQNVDGWSALQYATRRGRKTVVELLVSKGADVALSDKAGWTALHFAAKNGHKELLDLLLQEKKTDVKAVDEWGYTLLHLAAKGGRRDVVEFLLGKMDEAHINKVSKKGQTALWLAAANNHREVVKVLVACEKVDIRALAR